MDALTHILASANQRVYFNSVSASSTKALLWNMPPNNPEYGAWARRVMFVVKYSAVGGTVAPTSWQLGIKFQYEVPHTDGEQYLTPSWDDLDADTLVHIVEGVPWGTVQPTGDTGVAPTSGGFGVAFTNADSAGKSVHRTLEDFGRGCRIQLYPYAADGTAPYVNLTVLAIAQS